MHANSAADALDALVNAALMAGENVADRVVRKVFSSSIDVVVHLERGMDAGGSRIVRETMEILALVPSLHDDFTTEPIFARERLGAPLQWTGSLPPDDLARRLQRAMPESASLSGLLRHGDETW